MDVTLDPNNSGISCGQASLNFEPEAAEPAPVQEEQPQPQSELPKEFNLLRELQLATQPDESGSPSVSKDELAGLLEGFARALRGDSERADIMLADKNSEIAQLKELLLEAQETIIGLLNDRVYDRAKIARLESEVRVLPDLQSQASRAMGLAMRAEDVQKELAHVRAEVERLRTSYIKSEQGFLGRLFGRR